MKRVTLLIFAVLFLFSLTFIKGQYLQQPKIKYNFSTTLNPNITEKLTEKNPLLAGSLSFIAPGLAFGQIYNKQPGKFFIHTCITGGSLLIAVLSITSLNIDMGGAGSNNDNTPQWVFLFSTILFVGNWTWSVVDAVISANEINKKVQFKIYRSDVLDKLKFGFSHGKNKQLNFKLAFEL